MKMEAGKNLCTENGGEKKHSMLLPGPQTLICIKITKFCLHWPLKLFLLAGISAIEALNLAATI